MELGSLALADEKLWVDARHERIRVCSKTLFVDMQTVHGRYVEDCKNEQLRDAQPAGS